MEGMDMKTKYAVTLTDEERTYAHDILDSKGTPTGFRKRANALIMLDEGVGRPETRRQ